MILASPDLIASELAHPDGRVRRVTGTLCCDFTNGRVGERRDTYQHRAPVTRQLAARRDFMRQTLNGSGTCA